MWIVCDVGVTVGVVAHVEVVADVVVPVVSAANLGPHNHQILSEQVCSIK